jgi:hypothetical protein
VRLFPGIWMMIFTGDDAPQANGTDKASMLDKRAGTAIALRRNVSGCAKDIEKHALLPKFLILDQRAAGKNLVHGNDCDIPLNLKPCARVTLNSDTTRINVVTSRRCVISCPTVDQKNRSWSSRRDSGCRPCPAV